MEYQFVVPSQKEKLKAIGNIKSETKAFQKALSNFRTHFEDLELPGPDDWLACHIEKGQTFDSFQMNCEPPTRTNNRFYIQPLNEVDTSLTGKLLEFANGFFPKVNFMVRPAVKLSSLDVKKRRSEGKYQYHAGQILTTLLRNMPGNVYATIGITFKDLYNGDDNNYVFGLGSARTKTGVFSFARYYCEGNNLPLLEYCAVKVMVHEMCHIFGLLHCIYFNCLMNGSNHSEEGARKPFFLCPVCTRKLQYALKFDIIAWYRNLHNLFANNGNYFSRFAEWYSTRLSYLTN